MSTHRLTNAFIPRAVRLLASLLLAASPASAQTAAPLLVDSTWLAEHLNDRDLVVLHVGTKAEYEAGHIPGARLISEEDLSSPHDMSKMATDLMLELPPIEVLRTKVASLGISDDSRIVVYVGSNGVQSGTRIIFTLDYLGLGGRTSLLNGGLNAWTRAGKTTTTQTPMVRPGRLTARAPRNVVVDAAFVTSLSGRANHRLVDARAPVFFNGTEPTMNAARGHIPGAVNIPFSQVSDNNQMIDRDRAAALFQAAGIKPGDTIVAYCHVGQQATAVVFAARLLGHQVMLYDGSFQDWAYNARGQVEQ